MSTTPNWTEKELQIIKEFFPLLGIRKPKYHPSLVELLKTDISPYKLSKYCYHILNLRVNPQIGTDNHNKRCLSCCKILNLSEFTLVRNRPGKRTKGVSSDCKDCQLKFRIERRNRKLEVLDSDDLVDTFHHFEIYYSNTEKKFFIINTKPKERVFLRKDVKFHKNKITGNEYMKLQFRVDGKTKTYQRTRKHLECIRDGVPYDKDPNQIYYDEDLIIKYIRELINEHGTMVGFFELSYQKDIRFRRINRFCTINGGKKKYIELLDKLGINLGLFYFDTKEQLFRSSYEFKVFSILHHNNINYEYEKLKVENFIPDFYIKKDNLIIEVLGYVGDKSYDKKTKEKIQIYEGLGYKTIFIEVDEKRVNNSIFSSLSEYYEDLKIPNYIEYIKRYCVDGEKYLRNLKGKLELINNGKMTGRTLKSKYYHYYNFCNKEYGSVYESIKELIGYPSRFVTRPVNYWNKIENIEYELEQLWLEIGRFPKRKYTRKTRKTTSPPPLYQNIDPVEFEPNGKYYDIRIKLQDKHGGTDLDEENEKKFIEQTKGVLRKLNNGEIDLTDFYKRYRKYYKFCQREYESIFNSIIELLEIYPSPFVRRPKHYYETEGNILKELEFNWKRHKTLLTNKEIFFEKRYESTYPDLYNFVGIKEFLHEGKYHQEVLGLINKYGGTIGGPHRKLTYPFSSYDEEGLLEKVIDKLKKINNLKLEPSKGSDSFYSNSNKEYMFCVDMFGSILESIKELIGYPNPKLKRPSNYYKNDSNVEYEIENNYRLFNRLIRPGESRDLKDVSTMSGVYQLYRIKDFNEGGKWYPLIKTLEIKYS